MNYIISFVFTIFLIFVVLLNWKIAQEFYIRSAEIYRIHSFFFFMLHLELLEFFLLAFAKQGLVQHGLISAKVNLPAFARFIFTLLTWHTNIVCKEAIKWKTVTYHL